MDILPPDILPHSEMLNGGSYAERLDYFQGKMRKSPISSDCFVFVGSGCSLKVHHGALCLQQGALRGVKDEPIMIWPGVSPIKQIVFLSTSGYISLDAIHWCSHQGISIAIIDNDGHLLHSYTPGVDAHVEMRRLQYRACDAEMGISIARELVRFKTLAQINTLKRLPPREPEEERFVMMYGTEVCVTNEPVWKSLDRELFHLDRMTDVNALRLFEARMARTYWNALIGLPIQWNKRDEKAVPPHWRIITERISPLSYNAQRAINPFHAALNYMYAVVEHQLLVAIHTEGLDPACGFLHANYSDQSSLVYDLVEPLRPLVDGKVLSFFGRETFKRGDFTLGCDGRVLFNPQLLRYLVASCSLDRLIFGGSVLWLKNWLVSTGRLL